MRTLVHLSDLHFGRLDAATTAPLLAVVRAIAPDLVVVSGDLTQRARDAQFRAAREFLDALPAPYLVVPGNHDVPLFRVFERIFSPLAGYRRHVTDDLAPFWADEEIAVAGVNTARSLTWKGGRISVEQIAGLRARLAGAGGRTAVVVAHHPFDLPAGGPERHVVGRARLAMEALAECGVALLLTGHLHAHAVTRTAERYRIADHAAIVVQAGTATSARGRGEANSFNVVTIDEPRIEVRPWFWHPEPGAFAAVEEAPAQRFRRDGAVWRAEAG